VEEEGEERGGGGRTGGGGGGGREDKKEEELRGTVRGTTLRKTGNKISCSKFSPGVSGRHKAKVTT